MAIMKDVAKLAGVSVSTVSFVMNGTAKEHKVAEATARKVLAAARDLGYQLNASGVARNKPIIIALFIPSNYVMVNMDVIISGVNKHMKRCGIKYNIMLCMYEDNTLVNNIRQMSPSSYDAAVIIAGTGTDLRELEQLPGNLPLVLFNGKSNTFSSVSCQMEDSIRRAVSIVAAKQYRRIKIIASEDEKNGKSKIVSMLCKQCAEYGIELSLEHCISAVNSLQGGAIAARQILNLHEKPELVITTNTTLAYGAIPFLARNGFIFTRDAELLSFGRMEDVEHLRNYIPALSLIAVPTEMITMECFTLALHIAEGRQNCIVHYACPSELILNESFII